MLCGSEMERALEVVNNQVSVTSYTYTALIRVDMNQECQLTSMCYTVTSPVHGDNLFPYKVVNYHPCTGRYVIEGVDQVIGINQDQAGI